MAQAGTEEKQHAIDNGDYHHGVPAVSVFKDGGWSKRSHKHLYNAKSGVAVIFGAYTKKLLFMGVCNKFCRACAVTEKKNQQPTLCKCYRNWLGSSGNIHSIWRISTLREASWCTIHACYGWWRQLSCLHSYSRYHMGHSFQFSFNGGKQYYNWIQKGWFEHRCYAAGLRVQNGCQDFWKKQREKNQEKQLHDE